MRSRNGLVACLLVVSTSACSFIGTRPLSSHPRGAAERTCFDDYAWPTLDAMAAAGAAAYAAYGLFHPISIADVPSVDWSPFIIPALVAAVFTLSSVIGYRNVSACRRYQATLPPPQTGEVDAVAATLGAKLDVR